MRFVQALEWMREIERGCFTNCDENVLRGGDDKLRDQRE